jgi:hypothetical protein
VLVLRPLSLPLHGLSLCPSPSPLSAVSHLRGRVVAIIAARPRQPSFVCASGRAREHVKCEALLAEGRRARGRTPARATTTDVQKCTQQRAISNAPFALWVILHAFTLPLYIFYLILD